MPLLRAAAIVAAFSGVAAEFSPAGAPGACGAEGGDACGDQTGLLQMQMSSVAKHDEGVAVGGEMNFGDGVTAYGTHFMWRVAPRESHAIGCDHVCQEYRSTCVGAAFYQAMNSDAVDAAKVQATGTRCPGGTPISTFDPAAPYVFLGTPGSKPVCYYPSVVSDLRHSCSAPANGLRICPCSAQEVRRGGGGGGHGGGHGGGGHGGGGHGGGHGGGGHGGGGHGGGHGGGGHGGGGHGGGSGQCVQLKGIFCQGRDIECNCNYCDDFKQDTPCANSCRVMNGYKSSPYHWAPWTAKHNHNPEHVPNKCDCSWMRDHGDDCKQCNDCAYQCRKKNPFPRGTCRG